MESTINQGIGGQALKLGKLGDRHLTCPFYHFDLNGKLIAETPADGSVDQGTEHIFKGNGLLAQVDTSTGAIYSVHTNYLGAVHQLVDSDDQVVWEAIYQPFGRTVVSDASSVVNNWRMPGQYFDAESGLYYNYHRYYDAAIGRYLTPDPIGLDGGVNLYAYVQNNPVNLIDPLGLAWRQIRPLNIPGLRNTTRGPFHHDRFLYDDGTDSGYYSDSRVRPDDAPQNLIDQYVNVGEYLNDDVLRQAERNLRNQWDHMVPSDERGWIMLYDLFLHNCQDYADAVMEEYDRLMRERNNTTACR